ncbi:MAG: hypothetical protein IH991_18390, partial [Planctomycetes bacterium]|nr:hypothetical protein [Planctomycetota bacterium]
MIYRFELALLLGGTWCAPTLADEALAEQVDDPGMQWVEIHKTNETVGALILARNYERAVSLLKQEETKLWEKEWQVLPSVRLGGPERHRNNVTRLRRKLESLVERRRAIIRWRQAKGKAPDQRDPANAFDPFGINPHNPEDVFR